MSNTEAEVITYAAVVEINIKVLSINNYVTYKKMEDKIRYLTLSPMVHHLSIRCSVSADQQISSAGISMQFLD